MKQKNTKQLQKQLENLQEQDRKERERKHLKKEIFKLEHDKEIAVVRKLNQGMDKAWAVTKKLVKKLPKLELNTGSSNLLKGGKKKMEQTQIEKPKEEAMVEEDDATEEEEEEEEEAEEENPLAPSEEGKELLAPSEDIKKI